MGILLASVSNFTDGCISRSLPGVIPHSSIVLMECTCDYTLYRRFDSIFMSPCRQRQQFARHPSQLPLPTYKARQVPLVARASNEILPFQIIASTINISIPYLGQNSKAMIMIGAKPVRRITAIAGPIFNRRIVPYSNSTSICATAMTGRNTCPTVRSAPSGPKPSQSHTLKLLRQPLNCFFHSPRTRLT